MSLHAAKTYKLNSHFVNGAALGLFNENWACVLLFVHFAVSGVQDFIYGLAVRPLDCADTHAEPVPFQVVCLVPLVKSPRDSPCCAWPRDVRRR